LLKSPPEVSLTPPVSLASVSFNHTAGPGGKPLQISVMSAQNHKSQNLKLSLQNYMSEISWIQLLIKSGN